MADSSDDTSAALTATVRELRHHARATRQALNGLVAATARLDDQVQQLLALREEEPDLEDRLERLEGVLDAARIAAHVAAAVGNARVIDHPSPHAVIAPFLPPDVYQAAVEAIPPPVFFAQSGEHRLELTIPPALAPTLSVVTWRFLTTCVVEAIGPAIVDRFRDLLERHANTLRLPSADGERARRFTASYGRLVWRRPGYVARPRRDHPWHFLTTAINLARAGDTTEYGSVVHGATAGDPSAALPFAANSALIVFDVAGAHAYQSIPDTAVPGTERHTYEFPIGPDADTRRRLR